MLIYRIDNGTENLFAACLHSQGWKLTNTDLAKSTSHSGE
jgi:hypothetical protein